jgi:hypothetical protein
MTEVKKAFESWVKDPSDLEEVKDLEIIGSKVLIRLFFYDPPKKDKSLIIGGDASFGIIGAAAENIRDKEISAKFQIFPFGKVLAVGDSVTGPYEDLKPGDIITVMDDIKGTHLNPQWIQWMQEGGENARPKMKNHEPQQFIGNITQWKKDLFLTDKFKEKMELKDAFTFLLPQTFILTKQKV